MIQDTHCESIANTENLEVDKDSSNFPTSNGCILLKEIPEGKDKNMHL